MRATLPASVRGADGTDAVALIMTWTAARPWEVRLRFVGVSRRRRYPVWTVARELLADGVNGPAGIGDVTVIPWGDDLEIVLDPDAGAARVAVCAERQAVINFLAGCGHLAQH